MTLIVAYKDNDKIYLASDRYTMCGNYLSQNNRNKIYKFKNGYLASTGEALVDSMIDRYIRENDFEINSKDDCIDLYMGLLKSYDKQGFDTTKEDFWFTILLISSKGIFVIDRHGFIMEANDFYAVGLGDIFAFGYYSVWENDKDINKLFNVFEECNNYIPSISKEYDLYGIGINEEDISYIKKQNSKNAVFKRLADK